MAAELRRVLVVAAAAGLGIALALTALRMGRADWLFSRSTQSMAEWSAKDARPDFEVWLAVRDDLARAVQLEPRDPRALEGLGVLHAGRDAPVGNDRSGFQEQARDYLRRAAATRPTSPYTWANLAVVKYRLGETDEEFRNALRQAVNYGPWEWEVQAIVADVGLAMLPELAPAERSMVEAMVMNGMKRNPAEMLRIAQRRGSLSLACGMLDREAKGIDPQLAGRCDARKK
jgi:tetratricopeptide (TPR) repeat protein